MNVEAEEHVVLSETPRILVVDDSRLQRRILVTSLVKAGYSVTEAASGEEALEIYEKDPPDIILSDWVMPGISGLELCKTLRSARTGRYVYFIILTSKSEKGELERALREGADDFLAKPISSEELRGRITAGQRILRMERELTEKNRLVTKTLDEMRNLNEALDRDLIEARKLQMTLVPAGTTFLDQSTVDFWLQPSGHVGGDLVGIYYYDSDKVGFFALDVSGHGIASALITARLSSWLRGNTPDQNVALAEEDGHIKMRAPHEICRRLNTVFRAEIDTEHYFTIVIAQVDLASGTIELCQAGHPHPVIQRKDGSIQSLGAGGLPVGLIDDADYETVVAQVSAGDRFFLYSDGLSECPLPNGGMLEEEGVSALLKRHATRSGADLLQSLQWELSTLVDDQDLPDDVSAALFEYRV